MQDPDQFIKGFFDPSNENIKKIYDEIIANSSATFTALWQAYGEYSKSNLDIPNASSEQDIESFLRQVLPALVKGIGSIHLQIITGLVESELNRLSAEFFKDKKDDNNENV